MINAFGKSKLEVQVELSTEVHNKLGGNEVKRFNSVLCAENRGSGALRSIVAVDQLQSH